jgi:hypothetical protein
MTTDHQMAMASMAQQQLIIAFQAIGDPDLADRLECSMTARRGRHHCDGWPFGDLLLAPLAATTC